MADLRHFLKTALLSPFWPLFEMYLFVSSHSVVDLRPRCGDAGRVKLWRKRS